MKQINQALTFEIVVYGLDGAVRGDVDFDAAVIYDIDGSSALASSPTLFTYISASGVWRYTLSSGSNDAVGRYLARVDVTDDSNVAGSLVKYDYVDVGDVVVASLIDGAITAAKIAADAITSSQIANGALTAAKFASGAFDAVWAVAARVLTAGTNIALAKGVGVTGFNDLSAAQVNTEVDTALADYDAPTHTEMTNELAALNNFDPAADIVAHVTLVDTTTNLTNAPTAGDFTSTMKTSIGTALTGYGAATATNVAAVTTNVLAKLLKYVQLILRGDAGIATDNATEVTAINANGGSGAGGFDNTTDSQQALRDRGDAAWTTGAGGSAPTVEDIRTEMDTNSTKLANLDATIGSRASQTSVDDVPTNSELATALGTTVTTISQEIGDALAVDTHSELAGVPSATPTVIEMLSWNYLVARNRRTQTASTQTVYADNGTTPVATSGVTDDGTTLDVDEWA